MTLPIGDDAVFRNDDDGTGYIQFLDEPDQPTAEQFYQLFSPGPPVDDEGRYIPAGEAVTAAGGTPHTGGMIALVPTDDDARRLELTGGEVSTELHVTLFYLGDAVDIPDEAREALQEGLATRATEAHAVEATVFSVNIFNPTGEEPCLVLGVSDPDGNLVSLYEMIEELCVTVGVDTSMSHRPWIPHITLAYAEPPIEAIDVAVITKDRMGPVTFDRIRLALGDVVYDYQLTDAIMAATAFHLPGKHKVTHVVIDDEESDTAAS